MPEMIFKNQYVRDLAWVIASPPLIESSSEFQADFLRTNYFEEEYREFENLLIELDKEPDELIEHVKNGNTNLLGKYFESLVEFWLIKSHTKELLSAGLQVFRNRQTIGEFDFIYRDLTDGNIYHLECAGKFYLAFEQTGRWENFIGPNSIDNLGRKLHKIFTSQIELSKTREGKETLYNEGIEGRVIPKIFLKGYLFYYADLFFNNAFVMPEYADKSHPKGWWIYAKDIDYFFAGKQNDWIIIERSKWISKIYDPGEDFILNTEMLIEKLKKYFKTDSYPLLIAGLERNTEGITEEFNRGFIVSNDWPNAEI